MRTRCLSIRILAGVAVVALCTACVGHGNTGSQPVDAVPPPTVSSSRVELIIRNAKQEVVNLRADLGAARITAAKKEVEVGEMRREMAHIRQRISELQETSAQQHYAAEQQLVELTAVKAASEGDDLIAPFAVQPGQLDRGFVRFAAGVREEHP